MKLGLMLERQVKRAVFGALAGGSSGTRPLPGPDELATVRRILLVRPNFRLGNLVLATPALEVLARALPAAQIDVLCGAPYVDLLACDPRVHATIGVARDLHRHPPDLVRLVRRLRAARYDLVIDAARGSSFLGAFFAWASGGTLRVASAACRYGAFFNVRVVPDPQSWHKVDLLLDLLHGLGFEGGGVEPHVTVGAVDHRQAAEIWRSLGLDRHARVVGVALGARGRKQGSLEQIGDIVRGLHERVGVVLFAGPEDRERLAEVRRDLPPAVAVAPLGPIRVFAAMLARCGVVVTPDSGPMHLSAAVGTPTVTLVRAAQSAFYLPRAPQHQALDERTGDLVRAVLLAVDAALARSVAMPGQGGLTGG